MRQFNRFAYGLTVAAGCLFSCKADTAPNDANPRDSTTSVGGGGAISTGTKATECRQPLAICNDCTTLRCAVEAINCQRDQSCMGPYATMLDCLPTCSFGQCLSTFASVQGKATALTNCINQKCKAECSGTVPTASGGSGGSPASTDSGSAGSSQAASGGAAGSFSQAASGGAAGPSPDASGGTGGAGGAAGGSDGGPPAECKALSNECSECGLCDAAFEACSTDADCSAAAVPLSSCLLNKCDASCYSAFASTSPKAKAWSDCLHLRCRTLCF